MATKNFCSKLKFCDVGGVAMAVTHGALQAENEALRRELAQKDIVIAEQRAMIADRDATIVRLAGDLAKLHTAMTSLLGQRRGGRGGLHVQPGQMLLFAEFAMVEPPAETPSESAESASNEEAGDDEESERPKRKPRGEGKRRPPGTIDTTGLPRERQVHDLAEEERIDPVSGKPLVSTGERVTEELHYQRARIVVIEHVQPEYGLPPEEAEQRKMAPMMAPLPPKPFANCIASAVLLAWVLVQKFCNHLPLYRQQSIFERDGLRLSRKTQCGWALASAELLVPIADCKMRQIRAGPITQLDDTPIQCQGGRGERNFQARLWAFVNPEVPGVAYQFTPGRDSASLAALLGDTVRWLIGDGYGGNRAAANKVVAQNTLSPGIRLGGCWAHVNRKFKDAAKEAPGTARLFRDLIRKLYDIEHEADEAKLDPEARVELRRQRSMPVLLDIYRHAWKLRGQFSDAGSMAKAITYVRNQHRPLRVFLEDGRIPIDNNACERSIRPIAIGRRNWLFAGSMRGGRAAAVVFTLVECCRQARVDPVDYFADVLVRVGSHPASKVEELLPENWARLHCPKPAAEPAPA
jgi:transposase